MFPFSTITGGIGAVIGGIKSGIEKGYEKAKEFLSPYITSVRDSIVNVFTGVKEETTKSAQVEIMKMGHENDKSAAEWAQSARDTIAANEFDKAEGKPYAEKRLEMTKTLDAMVKNLSRDPKPDAEEIAEAEGIEKDWDSAVDAERKTVFHEPFPGDELLIPQITGFINSLRNGAGKPALRMNKKLNEDARHRVVMYSQKGKDKLPPYRLIRVPPTKREKVERTSKDFSQDEKDRASAVEAAGDEGFKATIPERDEDFLRHIREDKAKRDSFTPITLNFTLDLQDASYLLDGDPRRFLYEHLTKNDDDKLALLQGMHQVGIGIQRSGTKVYVSLIMTDETAWGEGIEDAPRIDRPEDYSSNEWWMTNIPEEKKAWKRNPADPKDYSIQQLFDGDPEEGRPPFRAGYSLYHFARFRDQIREFEAEGKDIHLLPVEVHPNETLGDKRYDTLHVTLMVGGEKRQLRLLRGTEIVEFPKTLGGVEDNKSVGDFSTIDEYLTKLKPLLQEKSESFPQTEQKPKKKAPQKPEEELPPGMTA